MTPPPAAAAARTVGDVLRAQGAITDEQLESALSRQRDTGQPLGQILVESGVITRLELASALAEQWSDAPHLVRLEPGKNGFAGLPSFPETITFDTPLGASAAERAILELRTHAHTFAARIDAVEARSFQLDVVQERLLELRQMVTGLADWASGPELRLAELESKMPVLEALEALDPGARLSTIDGHLGSLSERVEQVISAIDHAVTELEDVTAGLTETVATLTARVEGTATSGELEALRALVEQLAARSGEDAAAAAQFAGLAGRLDDLEARAGSATDVPQLEQVNAATSALAARLGVVESELQAFAARLDADATAAGVEELRSGVEELRSDVVELRSGVEELRSGVEELRPSVEELAARPAADPALPALLADLAARLDATAPASDLAEVRALAGELAGRPVVEPGAVAALAERVTELTARLDGLAVSADGKVDVNVVAELREAIEELARRPAVDSDLSSRIEDLARTAADAASAEDVEALRGSLAALSGRVDGDLPARLDEITARIDGLAPASAGGVDADALVALRATVDEVASRPAPDPSLAADVEALRASLDELAERPVGDGALAEEVAALRAEVEMRAAADVAAIDDLGVRLAHLETAGPSAGETADEPADGISARLADLELRLEAVALAQPAASDEAGGDVAHAEVEKLRVSVESLWMRMSEFQKSVAALLEPRGIAGKLDRLEARLEALEEGGGMTGGAATATTSSDLREIARRIEDMESAATSARETLLTRLERMASSIDWRLQRLETTDEG